MRTVAGNYSKTLVPKPHVGKLSSKDAVYVDGGGIVGGET